MELADAGSLSLETLRNLHTAGIDPALVIVVSTPSYQED